MSGKLAAPIIGLAGSMALCLYASHFLLILIGLELGTFAICFLLMPCGLERARAARFLMVSAVMTAAALYGISLHHYEGGSMSLASASGARSTVGNVLIVAWLLFKLGIAPFHAWMIDAYARAPLGLVAFLDIAWKFLPLVVFARVSACLDITQLKPAIMICAAISMLIGSIMPAFQTDIRRFVAYSSSGHLGLVMTVFAAEQSRSMIYAVEYLAAYAIASACFFTSICILGAPKIETFDDIAGIIDKNRMAACGVVISLFAMVGIPPFVNFAAKLQILKLQANSGYYALFAISIIYSMLCVIYAAQKVMVVFTNARK